MLGLFAIFDDVVIRVNPNWYMVGFNVTAFIISTFFIGIIVAYLNAKVSSRLYNKFFNIMPSIKTKSIFTIFYLCFSLFLAIGTANTDGFLSSDFDVHGMVLHAELHYN